MSELGDEFREERIAPPVLSAFDPMVRILLAAFRNAFLQT
jgi:hypothetical protein